MSLKATSPRSTPAQDASRRAGLRGLRSERARASVSARVKTTRRAPPSRLQSSAGEAIDETPLTGYERNMAHLVSLSLWAGMASFLFLQRAAFFAAAQSAARAIGLG